MCIDLFTSGYSDLTNETVDLFIYAVVYLFICRDCLLKG